MAKHMKKILLLILVTVLVWTYFITHINLNPKVSTTPIINYVAASPALEPTSTPTTFRIITSTPATALSAAYRNGSFDSIIAFASQRTKGGEWLLETGDIKVDYAINSKGRTAYTDATSPYSVHLSTDITRYNPYVVTAILVHELRHAYDYERHINQSCIPEEIVAYTWASTYWQGITEMEKQPRDLLVVDEDKRLRYFEQNRVEDVVREDYKDICPN